MEVREEAAYIPQHKKRLAFFFAAMRHFRDEQRARGRRVVYSELDDPENRGDLANELLRRAEQEQACSVVVVEPGDWRVREKLAAIELPIEFFPDRHFLCDSDGFSEFAVDHPEPVMETFYRFMRRRYDILIEADGSPTGGSWNFDASNRESFSRRKPPKIPLPLRFTPDATTQQVLNMVVREFPDSPGRVDEFDMAVSRNDARQALQSFVTRSLSNFGQFQDAMLDGEAFLFHSALSGSLNLHLLDPREVLQAALANEVDAPLNAVEGFVRQILGWREFVHALYWRRMPHYAEENALEADLPMPGFFWSGETDMRCLAAAIGHTLIYAYAHHIERLMVLGLFCLLLGVRPYDVHRWHMSMFRDAIDWVSLPNTLGMSQYGDGGVIGTKPYVASGNYINRMSGYCRSCRYDPRLSTGESACPFTTLYWDFLARHKSRLKKNPRMKFQYMNLARKDPDEVAAIRRQAESLKARFSPNPFF